MKTKGISILTLSLIMSQGINAANYTPVENGVVVHTTEANVRLKVINDKIGRAHV